MEFKVINNFYETVGTVTLNGEHEVDGFLMKNNKGTALLISEEHLSFLDCFMDNFYCVFDKEHLEQLKGNTGALYFSSYEDGYVLEI